MSEVVLDFNGATKSFGGLKAVDELSFQVYENEILSIIGPNGSGKTTTFNLITGLYEPDSGDILLKGRVDRGPAPGPDPAQGHLPHVPDAPALLEHDACSRTCWSACTARRSRERLHPCSACRVSARKRRPCARRPRRSSRCSRVASPDHASRTPRPRSRTRTVAASRSPERSPPTQSCLLLDEPVAGMNPKETLEVMEQIKDLREGRIHDPDDRARHEGHHGRIRPCHRDGPRREDRRG